MKIKSIKNRSNWRQQKVLLRLDLNVPLAQGKLKDDYKLVASLPTIKYLLTRGASLILISHLGRPNNQVDRQLSLQPIARRLQELLGEKIVLVDDLAALELAGADNQILMLENLRFFKEEEANSAAWAKKLAKLADVYVNDALAVSHRLHTSVAKIKNYLPSYAGLLLEAELINFNKALKPDKPMIVLMGGVKVSTKAALLNRLEKQADQILLGGGLANTFMYYLGLEVGNSVYEQGAKKFISPFIVKGQLAAKIVLPTDVLVKTRLGKLAVRPFDQVRKTEAIFDIGPNTIINYCQLLKPAKTIIWNGPMGKFEETPFKHGTLTLAIMIASLADNVFSVVGGGETLRALKLTKMGSYVSWLSTGGGAMLTYLGGEPMPGLDKIVS